MAAYGGAHRRVQAGAYNWDRVSEMKLKTILAKHKSAIVKQWVDSIVETYPSETAKFLKNKKDQ